MSSGFVDTAIYAESWHIMSYICAMMHIFLLQDWSFHGQHHIWHSVIVHQAAMHFSDLWSALVHHA